MTDNFTAKMPAIKKGEKTMTLERAIAHPLQSSKLPPLESGDRLTRVEFERRYERLGKISGYFCPKLYDQ